MVHIVHMISNTCASLLTSCHYRPQRSCGQGNIFTPVCHSVHRGEGVCLSACWDTIPRIRHQPPPDQTPPPRPGRTPQTRQTPPQARQTPPWTRQTPQEADSSIRSTSGRFASYWNAFLLYNCSQASPLLQ